MEKIVLFLHLSEAFHCESYRDKRKCGVLEVNVEEHNSFNKVLKEKQRAEGQI